MSQASLILPRGNVGDELTVGLDGTWQALPEGSGGADPNPVNPLVVNINLLTAGTEYSYALPAATKQFEIKLRSGRWFKLNFFPNEPEFISVRGFFGLYNLSTNAALILYFASDTSGEVAEIISWT